MLAISGVLAKHPGLGKAIEKKVEINQATVRLPLTDGPLDRFIIHWPFAAQPRGQSIASADIVSGKDICPAETAQQRVLGRPAPDPAKVL